MSWISIDDIATVFPTIENEDPDHVQGIVDHIQGLAELEIGAIAEASVDKGLTAVMVQIWIRFWRGIEAADANPAGFQSENIEGYGYSVPTGSNFSASAGLGLTNAEVSQLKKAIGRTGLWVQPTTRGELETAPRNSVSPAEWLEGVLGD